MVIGDNLVLPRRDALLRAVQVGAEQCISTFLDFNQISEYDLISECQPSFRILTKFHNILTKVHNFDLVMV